MLQLGYPCLLALVVSVGVFSVSASGDESRADTKTPNVVFDHGR